MNNKEFIAELSKRLERDATDVNVLVEGFSSLLKDKCGALECIAIPGFGKFAGEKHLEHVEVSQETGKRTMYPPQIRMEYVPSAILKSRMEEKGGADGK